VIAAEDDSFDVALCQHGLQFFPDRPAAATEMRRVARPGGTAVISTWPAERPLPLSEPHVWTRGSGDQSNSIAFVNDRLPTPRACRKMLRPVR